MNECFSRLTLSIHEISMKCKRNQVVNLSYLENITNSRKDLVGNAQLCMTDHVPPSTGMGGKESKSRFMPYILLRDSAKANLQPSVMEKVKLKT